MQTAEAPATAPTLRSVGIVYLLYFVLAFLAGFLMKGLVLPQDAAATASNLIAHEHLYRAAFAVNLVANAFYIAVTALFYRVFKPVDANLSLIAAAFSLTGCTVQIVGGLLQLAPLVILLDAPDLSQPLPAATALSLKLYSQVFRISLVLFAFYDILLGYLIVRSHFVPRALGLILIVAGVGWMTFLWPPLATTLTPVVLPFGALAELLFMSWLVIKGRRPIGT
jgi:hypothetical protein